MWEVGRPAANAPSSSSWPTAYSPEVVSDVSSGSGVLTNATIEISPPTTNAKRMLWPAVAVASHAIPGRSPARRPAMAFPVRYAQATIARVLATTPIIVTQ